MRRWTEEEISDYLKEEAKRPTRRVELYEAPLTPASNNDAKETVLVLNPSEDSLSGFVISGY